MHKVPLLLSAASRSLKAFTYIFTKINKFKSFFHRNLGKKQTQISKSSKNQQGVYHLNPLSLSAQQARRFASLPCHHRGGKLTPERPYIIKHGSINSDHRSPANHVQAGMTQLMKMPGKSSMLTWAQIIPISLFPTHLNAERTTTL